MLIEFYTEKNLYGYELIKKVELPFVPTMGSFFHDTESKKSYSVEHINFTESRVIVEVDEYTGTSYFQSLTGLNL